MSISFGIHMQLFKFKLRKVLKVTSSAALVTFQVSDRHLWLAANILNSTDPLTSTVLENSTEQRRSREDIPNYIFPINMWQCSHFGQSSIL